MFTGVSRSIAAWSHFLRWYWQHGGEEIWDPMGPSGGPFPVPWRAVMAEQRPHPDPWIGGAWQIVRLVQAQELARALPEGEEKQALARSSSAALDALIDELCPPFPKWPRPQPWPWPGPPPWIWEMAGELTGMANNLNAGSLRDGLLDAASRLVLRSSGNKLR